MNKIIEGIINWFKFSSEDKKNETELSESQNSSIGLATEKNEALMDISSKSLVPKNFIKIENQGNADSLVEYVQGSITKSLLTKSNFKNLYKGNSKGSVMLYKDGTYSSIIKNKKSKIIGKSRYTPAKIAKLKALTLVLASEITGHAHMYKIKEQLSEISNKLNVLREKTNHTSIAALATAHNRIADLDKKQNYIPNDLNELRRHINDLHNLKTESELNFKSACDRLINSKQLQTKRSNKKIVRLYQDIVENVQNTGAKISQINQEIDDSDIFLYAQMAVRSEQLQQVGELLELKIFEYLSKKDSVFFERFQEDLKNKINAGVDDVVTNSIAVIIDKLNVKVQNKKEIFSNITTSKSTTKKIKDFQNHFSKELIDIRGIARNGSLIEDKLKELEKISNQEFEFIIVNTEHKQDVYIHMIKE